jgi:hypothetical protein
MPVIRSQPQFENRDDGGTTKQPEDRVVQRLRRIETDAAGDGQDLRNGLEPRLFIAFVSDPKNNAITYSESATRIGFPDASVEWSAEAAGLFLSLLSRVAMNDAKELARLASTFALKSHDTKHHAATWGEKIDVALSEERQRIAALLPKKEEPKPKPAAGAPPESAASLARRRETARKALDDFDILASQLGSAADDLSARMGDLEDWWKLAEVSRAAQNVAGLSTGPVDAAGTALRQPLADLRAAVVGLCVVLDEAARKQGESAPDVAPTPAPARPLNLVKAAKEQRAATLSESILEFLDLPRQEALAYFMRMLDNVGTHPLLSIGALGGLLGLFAYAKALAELDALKLSPVGLITSGDITDFALRLAPAFLLSCVAALSIVGFWVVALAFNHRKAWTFAAALAACGALLWFAYTALIEWAPPHNYWQLDWLGFGLAGALLLVLFPIVMLFVAGQRPGVQDEDVWQRFILRSLRVLSDGRGLLLLFIALGLGLLGSERFSVLFAKGAPPLPQEPSLVLETKLYEHPIPIDATFSRLSTVWIVRRITGNAAPWSIVASSEVACVRSQTPLEQGTKSLTNACTNPRPATAFLPDTIAGYATTFYRCERNSFSDQRSIAVMTFETGVPTTPAAIGAAIVKERLRRSTAEKLAVPGLVGLLHAQEQPPSELIKALRDDPAANVVVLGFASTAGRSSNNDDLSERRAIALRRSLLTAAGYQEPESANLQDRVPYRGLGEGLLSGLFGVQEAVRDQVAVAFLCDRR